MPVSCPPSFAPAQHACWQPLRLPPERLVPPAQAPAEGFIAAAVPAIGDVPGFPPQSPPSPAPGPAAAQGHRGTGAGLLGKGLLPRQQLSVLTGPFETPVWVTFRAAGAHSVLEELSKGMSLPREAVPAASALIALVFPG